jgi:hypothetical protein
MDQTQSSLECRQGQSKQLLHVIPEKMTSSWVAPVSARRCKIESPEAFPLIETSGLNVMFGVFPEYAKSTDDFLYKIIIKKL